MDDGTRTLPDKFLACPECRSPLYRCGKYGDAGGPGTLVFCSSCAWRGVLLHDRDTKPLVDHDRQREWLGRRGLSWHGALQRACLALLKRPEMLEASVTPDREAAEMIAERLNQLEEWKDA